MNLMNPSQRYSAGGIFFNAAIGDFFFLFSYAQVEQNTGGALLEFELAGRALAVVPYERSVFRQ